MLDLVYEVLEAIPELAKKVIQIVRTYTLKRVLQILRIVVNDEDAKLGDTIEASGK